LGRVGHHAIELQLTVAALQGAGFCKAWHEIHELWAKHDTTAWSTMQEKFFQTLKTVANHKDGLFFTDAKFNGEKRAFVKAVISGKPPKKSDNIKGYFNTHIQQVVAGVAQEIDEAAVTLMDNVIKEATAAAKDDEAYECALEVARSSFADGIHPVSKMWATLRLSIVK